MAEDYQPPERTTVEELRCGRRTTRSLAERGESNRVKRKVDWNGSK